MFKDIENRLGTKIEDARILKSGWAGEIISLRLKDSMQKYIVKTYSSSTNGLQNIKQEWAGLSLLYKENYSVPKPIINNFISEKPYIVMEEIEGENLWNCYEHSSKECRDQLLNRFARALYELHELDISIVDKNLIKDSTSTFIEKELNEIKKLAQQNNLNCFPEIINWLEKEKVDVIGHKLSIIHRDYHPWNVIVSNNEKLYVFDLLWGIGDYRFDLAWMYTLMERSGFENFSHKAFKKYRELKNENINNFEYFKVLATVRWLVNVMISLEVGENLNETRKEEFRKFILPLIKKGIGLIQEITSIKICSLS